MKPDVKTNEFQSQEEKKVNNFKLKIEEIYGDNTLDDNKANLDINNPLTTKDAVKYLLEGTLKEKVCRYCLNSSFELSNLDELITIARNGTLFSVSIKQMIASFHPVRIDDDPNFPTKICQTCLNRTINSYLFTQQCEQSERALRDCFEDMYEKVLKLDPLEQTKRRGRYKLKPNHNVLHTEHKYVINYAVPTIHINSTVIQLPNESKINPLECLKCSQLLPDTISLLNHVKSHPKSQWFNCRLCGKSFPKLFHLKKHFRQYHTVANQKSIDKSIKCNICGVISDNYQQFYQHKQKHKFRNIMKHLFTCKMDKLCTICLDKGSHMIGIEENVNLHGGFPELTGDKSVISMVDATLPQINIINNHTGTKICKKCYNNVLTSYLFITKTYILRNKLDSCIKHMINKLASIEPDKNLSIEISQDFIMPEVDINIIKKYENDIEILEDEFRIESESNSENESKDVIKSQSIEPKTETVVLKNNVHSLNKARKFKSKTVNGCQKDVSEFLTFKKKKLKTIKFTCPICYKYFISSYFLKRHILKHSNKNHFCSTCNVKFKSKFGFNEHNKFHNQKTDYWTCSSCERIYTNYSKYILHLKKHKRINCQLCNKIYKSQSFYIIHLQNHMKKLRYIKKCIKTCSFCEKECSNDNQLSLHVNKVHLQIKPYQCDMCDLMFYTEHNLRCHKKVHNMYSKEKCTFCSKILKSRAKFVVHLRRHIDVKPFTCQICFEAFYSETKLKKHLKIHLGIFR